MQRKLICCESSGHLKQFIRSFAAGTAGREHSKRVNINEGIFVVTTPNLQKTHSRAREGCGSLSSTLLMDVGELGARSRTPHCAQQWLCYHCCLQTSFRQWRVKRAQWEDKFGLSEPSSTWCCLAWCFTGNPLRIFLPLRIDI